MGGDEFSDECREMDRAILSATGARHPSVLVVPTAAAFENPSLAASNGIEYFAGLGADVSALMVVQRTQADAAELLSPIDSADLIYFTGGNPSHLLDVLAESLLLQKLREALERGAVLAGSSAGAMVLGSWMRFRRWREALGVVPGVAVLPHHERSDPDAVSKELAKSAPPELTAMGIDAMTCCLGGPKGWKALGAGSVTVYRGGQWRRFASGQTLTLNRESTDFTDDTDWEIHHERLI
jgi:cyanophycinase